MMQEPEPRHTSDQAPSAESDSPLATTAARASLWVAVSAVVTQLILLGSSVVMARLLTPTEFGIVEICITVALFVNLIGENGFSAEIVQHQSLSPNYLATAFWTNVGIGALLTVAGIGIVAIGQPWLGGGDVALLLSITMFNFVVSGVSMVQRVLLVRSLQFATITRIELTGMAVFAIVGTALAFAGMSGLGYVLAWLIRTVVISIFLFFQLSWRPSFVFHAAYFRQMIRFGSSVFAGRALVYANSSVDRFVVLSTLGGEQLGFYTLSRRMPTAIASLLYSIVLRVSYPVMSKVQTEQDRMKHIYVKTVEYLALLVIPPMILLAVVAEPFVVVLFGANWQPAVFATRMMALTPLFVLIVLPSDSAFQATGRPDLVWKTYALRMLIYIPCLFIGVQFGTNGTAVAVLAYTVLAGVTTQFIVKHILGITWLSIWQATWPTLRNSLTTAIFTGAVLVVLNYLQAPEVVTLLVAVAVGAAVYLMVFRIFNAASLLELVGLAARATNQPWFERRIKTLLQL
jgi:PST family polysaccharide transporter